MTRNTKRGSVSAFATGVIAGVVTDGRGSMHLLAQAKERTQKNKNGVARREELAT
jgi:hypothetical protein